MELIKSAAGAPREGGAFSFQTPVSGHIPVPDGAEAGRLLTRSGEVTVDRLTAEDGAVTAEGRVVIRPLCLAADGLYAFESSAPFRQTIPCCGAEAGGAAEGGARLTALQLTPRGGGFELMAQVDAAGVAIAASPVETVSAVSGAEDAELLRRELMLTEENAAGTTAFRLRDEMRAPGVSRVHAWDAAVSADTLTERDGEADVACTLTVSVLYTDEDGVPVQIVKRLPFTETLPLDGQGELRAEASAKLARVTPYSGDIPMIAVEADVQLTVYAIRRRRQLFTLDAFSPAAPFEAVREAAPIRVKLGAAAHRATVADVIALPDGMPAIDRAVYARAVPLVTECEAADGRVTVTGILDTAILYAAADGALYGFDGEAAFSESFDCPAEANAASARVAAIALPPAGGGSEAEITCEMFFVCDAYRREELLLLTGVAEGGARPPRRGLVGYYAEQGESAFSVAKRFGVPVASLGAAGDTLEAGEKLIFFA